jgi:hypothetical protein
MLKSRFIPVAIDQAYQRRQKDAEGEFYRRIAGQGPRNDFQNTTQGFYAAGADGTLLFYNNNRDPGKVRRLMEEALEKHRAKPTEPIKPGQPDERYRPDPPEGGLVVRVRSKILDGFAPTEDRWQQILQGATSRDNLWISRWEHEALAGGSFPRSLAERLSRFHLVDSTRGEPSMWKTEEIRGMDYKLQGGILRGQVRLETADGARGYHAEIFGRVETANGVVTRFDGVAKGSFWGEGRYTKGAPAGKFPLAISFELADGSDVADAIPPQGSRGWVPGYMR